MFDKVVGDLSGKVLPFIKDADKPKVSNSTARHQTSEWEGTVSFFLSLLFSFFCWFSPNWVLCDLIPNPHNPDSIQLWFKHSCWTGAGSRDPKATVIYCVRDNYRDWQLQSRKQVSAWSLYRQSEASVFCLYMHYIWSRLQTFLQPSVLNKYYTQSPDPWPWRLNQVNLPNWVWHPWFTSKCSVKSLEQLTPRNM